MYSKKLMLLFLVIILSLSLAKEVEAQGGSSRIKLAINDSVSSIEAVFVKNTYYVPLRDLAKELNWLLVGLSGEIAIKGQNGTLKLSITEANSITPNGMKIAIFTFIEKGKMMVPVKVASYLGYKISYKPEQYLLRVKDASSKLGDADFAKRYKSDLKPEVVLESPSLTAEKQQGDIVYLTFDDGPSATTSQLLDMLSEYDAKATFFMLGPYMSTYPEQVKRIAKGNHGLGLHGITHRKEKFYASPAVALAEMNEDNRILKKISGMSTTLIRTPYGSKPYFTDSFRNKILSKGYHLWDWNVDSEDWKYKEDSEEIYNSVMDQLHKLKKYKINPVILMHDQKATLKVLPSILESLIEEGYQFEIITGDTVPLNFWKDLR